MKTTTRLKPPCQPSYEPAPLRAVVADVSGVRLSDFRDLMAGEGWAVDLARMCHDRLYAYEPWPRPTPAPAAACAAPR
jgi:hypothetical protein